MTVPASRRARSLVASGWIVGLSAAMTLLNAVKPLHMDDAVYHMYAAQIAAHPGDPYGGEVVDYWFAPKPGMDVLAPVFLPYLWSRALLVHGDDPFLCKLWLAPFPLLLVGASWSLARRYARGLEPVVAGMVAFSPAILPGQNFMLDVPALALGLAALALFARACDRRSATTAILAGLLAGAAINTKWTGLLVPAVIGLHALTRRRVGLGAAAILASVAVFAGWEAWIAHLYGTSHFLLHSARKQTPWMDRLNGVRALVAILGGVAPAVLMLGLVALRRPRCAAVAGCLAAAGIAAIGLGVGPQAVFLPFGTLVFLNLGHVAAWLLRRRADSGRLRWRSGRDDLFLAAWLGLEVVGFFVLSPYSAVRRVLGIVVAATLLAARLASRTGRSASLRAPARWAAVAGMALGAFYYAIDLGEAVVESRAARDAARRAIVAVEPGRTAWFAGRWGFRHHAMTAGLTPVVPGRSGLEPGDLLVVHDNKVDAEPRIVIDPSQAEEVFELRYDAPPPFPALRTVPSFYAGKNPIERSTGPRLVVHVYRVTRPFTAIGMTPRRLAPRGRAVGALRRGGRSRR